MKKLSMNTTSSLRQLLEKYDVPTPRYTSYPTVPYWDFSTINETAWSQSVIDTFKKENGELCLYIHLPFCENMCTFCACNKRITKNHAVEVPYMNAVLKEWEIYRSLLPGVPVIKEIHLGGGTPTFFSADHLMQLIQGIIAGAVVAVDHEFSIEVHPNYTTEDHLEKLASIGFNRMSVGVQDFDPVVQHAINRIQTFEKTKEVIDWAKKHGYKSINIDLIYGLPHQTVKCIKHTIQLIKLLQPGRIAFYSYAHVPWKSKVQRRYSEEDLPRAAEKWEMYHTGRALLEAAGFISIGMDHFALKEDPLFAAAANEKLHRNFMGYTTTGSKLIIALGVSAISDSWNAFAQNEKVVEIYEEKIAAGKLPLVNGHLLNEEEITIRKNILELMCKHKTNFDNGKLEAGFTKSALCKLKELEKDELVVLNDTEINVTSRGKSFIRNISAAIDLSLWKNEIKTQTFSKAI